MNQLIRRFDVLSVNEPLPRLSSEFLRQYRKSHRLDPSDTIIVATAEIGGYDLVTLNLEHSPIFPHLQRPY